MQSRLDNTNVSAGFFPRAAAFLIDCLLVGLATSLVKIISFFVELATRVTPPDILFRYDLVDIICYIITAAYFAIFTGLTGSTLGKKAMRLQVVRQDGGHLSFYDALYRETIGRYLSSILCIGYIVAACDPENRGFHDMLADTRVVYVLPRKEKRRTQQEDVVPEAY